MPILRSYGTYITSIVAFVAAISFTLLVLGTGIAAACEGTDPPPCQAPSVTTDSASPSYTSAWLYGWVDPNGCETTYTFKYGKTTSYEDSRTGSAGSSNSNTSVSDWASGLQPNTTYHYRLYATNSGGTNSGVDKTFTTPKESVPPPPPLKPPSVTTEAASGITSLGATLNGSVNPNGLPTTYRFEYGPFKEFLYTATSLVSAGEGTTSKKVEAKVELEPGIKYYFRISASNSEGTAKGTELSFTTSAALWKIKETLNPGESDSNLYDVSCEASTSACTAVGTSTSAGVDSPMVQRWNGTSWSAQSPAKKSGTLPTRLFGVDCPSEARCMAVGNYQSSEGPVTVAELWNEGKWSVQTTPVPAESTSSELVGVGCSSTASCTAVGSAVIGGVEKAIAAKWSSPNWSSSSIPIPEGAKSSKLEGVDCIWSNFCVAVGQYVDSSSDLKSLVLFWNGSWSLQTVTDPEKAEASGLTDVSCTPTPNRCTAVGIWQNSAGEQFTLAHRFNGSSTWTPQSTPSPSASKASIFEDVSCASETSCTAVGSWFGSATKQTKTLAAEWNGSSWSRQSTSNPTATFSSLFGVSCRGSSCFGAGWSTSSSGVDTTLSEFRE